MEVLGWNFEKSKVALNYVGRKGPGCLSCLYPSGCSAAKQEADDECLKRVIELDGNNLNYFGGSFCFSIAFKFFKDEKEYQAVITQSHNRYYEIPEGK